MLHSRLSHVCDACKARKVKCHSTLDLSPVCINCRDKGIPCVFSPLKRKFKSLDQRQRDQRPQQSSETGCLLLETTRPVDVTTPLSSASLSQGRSEDRGSKQTTPQLPNIDDDSFNAPLYMDQLLQTRQATGRTQNASFLLGANEHYLASSSTSFFSDSRLDDLSARLGNDALKSLIAKISSMVRARVEVLNRSTGPPSIWNPSGEAPILSAGRARYLFNIYFESIHPLYPFLDRQAFEAKAFSPNLDIELANEASWAALYYSVLALGCEFDGGGSFAPGEGEPWSFFKVALDHYPKVLLLNTDLLEVQAITAMAIFCLNLSGTQIQGKIISEAARLAQRAFLNKACAGTDATIRSQVFWVVYYIEKTISFHHGTTSFIVDCDIGSPIPFVEEAVFDNFDWFLASIKFARLYSRVFTELFSISATKNSTTSYISKITDLERLLEQQFQSTPLKFKPGYKLRPQAFSHPCAIAAAIRVHYHYHELKIALHRLKLHVTREQIVSSPSTDAVEMIRSACAVIEISRVIQQEPMTPYFILVYMPLTALFVLFDQIIHNPALENARSCLALLESVAGYFSALEYTTNGYLPGSMLIQFASIAREFYSNYQSFQDNPRNGGGVNFTTSEHPIAITPITEQCISQVPLEAATQPTTDYSFQYSPSFSNSCILPDTRFTPGFDIMNLFWGPAHDSELFTSLN